MQRKDAGLSAEHHPKDGKHISSSGLGVVSCHTKERNQIEVNDSYSLAAR